MNPRALLIPILLTTASIFEGPASADDKQEIPFSKAKILIEYNASAEDVGIQVLLDGEPWKKLAAFNPGKRRILDVTASRSLAQQGLTEFFFESSEPSLADVPLSEFLARFPRGNYRFEGETTDGVEVEGTAVLNHRIPAGPEIVSPVSSNDDPPVVDPSNVVIEWEPVTETITGSSNLTIAGYQVIVEQVEPHRVFSIDLPETATSVTVPAGFLIQRDRLHIFEVLAIEQGGNQTITEGEFMTLP